MYTLHLRMVSCLFFFLYVCEPIFFLAGLHKQMDRIPLKFFVEQLGDQKRIVFTGI